MVQEDITNVDNWVVFNGLKLNEQKTYAMLVGFSTHNASKVLDFLPPL